MRTRSSAPAAVTYSSPNASRIFAMAAPPAAVRRWASASASTMEIPRCAKRAATVDLPLPMPPVRPIRTRRSADTGQERRGDLAPEEDHDESRWREVDPKRQFGEKAGTAHSHERKADDRTHPSRNQDDGQERGPAKPGSECRQ